MDHKGTYVIQETFWSKSMIGKFFGAQPKILGTLENPTLAEKKELGMDPLGLSPIIKDLDGNFLKTFHDAVKDDKTREVLFSAGMFATDLIGDGTLLYSVGEAAIEGGAKLGLSTLVEGSFKADDLKNLFSESVGEGVISSLPIVGSVKSGQNLLDNLDNNGISDRDAFFEVKKNKEE
ncbi:MAG: hypothetical protein PQJ46_01250 [Spirochaetales bacterium]|nr:hypothetical protein [Spirochaetales bacterium]